MQLPGCRDLLHAADLRHGTDGFTSPRKEGMLRIFSPEKSDGNFSFYVHGSVHHNYILLYNSNQIHKLQSLFNLMTALHVSDVNITHLQEHKTTASTASGNHCTVIDGVNFTDKEYR
jgi:hypothetical protein